MVDDEMKLMMIKITMIVIRVVINKFITMIILMLAAKIKVMIIMTGKYLSIDNQIARTTQ